MIGTSDSCATVLSHPTPVVWVIFLIDMPVQFNTAYIRGDRLVISRRRVAKHYLRTFFFLDLIACIPFDAFLEDDDQDAEANQLSRFSRIPRALRLIRLIRLVRVVRLLNLRRYARRIETLFALNPSILRLGRTLAAALFMLHIVAGMWNYTALLDDPDNPDVWVNQRGIADAEPELRYLVSVYWALTTMTSVGYGDSTYCETCAAPTKRAVASCSRTHSVSQSEPQHQRRCWSQFWYS